MCLLCACLSWLAAYSKYSAVSKTTKDLKELQELHAQVFGINVPFKMNRDCFLKKPVIYYASRTHSQLSQSLAEVKNTVYKPKISVLGSRDQLCVDETVKMASSGAKSSLCKASVKKRICEYHENVDSPLILKELNDQIMDIEELIEFGQVKKACPFYLSRNMITDADIIFLPYNYLIDSKSRKSMNINLQNSIIIFDEGISNALRQRRTGFKYIASDIRADISPHCCLH